MAPHNSGKIASDGWLRNKVGSRSQTARPQLGPRRLGRECWRLGLQQRASKAIISYRIGKRDSNNTDHFVRDLRERVLGLPEISSDGFKPYMPAIRDRERAHCIRE